MPNTNECETCGGEGVLIGDKADARGERTDDVQPCPDCSPTDADVENETDACAFDPYDPVDDDYEPDQGDAYEYDDRDAFLDGHGEP